MIVLSVWSVACADMWRYAALYAFGGFYIDDDADFHTPPDQVSSRPNLPTLP